VSPFSRSRLAVLTVSAGLVLAGCGGGAADEDTAAGGHDGHGAVAQVEGPEDRYAGLDLPDPYQRPSFTLTGPGGRPYDFAAETGGKADAAVLRLHQLPRHLPTTMADVAVALRGVDPALAEQVQVVFVTTDPAFDTPEVLAEYLGRFDADLPTRFVGLTGDQAAIDQAQLAAGVPQAEDNGRLHSSLLLLYGADDLAHVGLRRGQHQPRHRRGPRPGGRGVSRAAARLLVVVLGALAGLLLAGPAQAHVGGGAAAATSTRACSRSTRRCRCRGAGAVLRRRVRGGQPDRDRRRGARLLRRALPAHRPDGGVAQRQQPGDLHQPRPLRPHDAARARRPRRRTGLGAGLDRARLRLARPPDALDERGRAAARRGRRPDPRAPGVGVGGADGLRRDEVHVRGELTWSPPPPARVVWPVYAVLALAPVAAAVLTRGPLPLGALLVVGGAAALFHAGSTPEPAASVSSYAGALVSALLPGLIAAAVAVGGLVAAPPGPGRADRAAGRRPRLVAAGAGAARRRRAVDGERAGRGGRCCDPGSVAVLVALGAGASSVAWSPPARLREPERSPVR
jgi:protein SCO1/2